MNRPFVTRLGTAFALRVLRGFGNKWFRALLSQPNNAGMLGGRLFFSERLLRCFVIADYQRLLFKDGPVAFTVLWDDRYLNVRLFVIC